VPSGENEPFPSSSGTELGLAAIRLTGLAAEGQGSSTLDLLPREATGKGRLLRVGVDGEIWRDAVYEALYFTFSSNALHPRTFTNN
jgi:hypothetical protein